MDIDSLRADYPITERCTYLNHAAVGPVSTGVAAATAKAARMQSEDPAAMNAALAARSASVRELAARLLGAAPERIAFIGNTSHGLSLIANGLDWQHRDQVILSNKEFPSNYLPWLQQQDAGVELVNLPLVNGCLTPGALADVITPRTRVVAISHVQYHNGFRADIAGLARVARAHDALLVVDGTQSIGAMQFDLDGWDADALVFSGHKWMLCPKGIGLMVLSERALERIKVTIPGWQSVNDRFAFRRELDFLPSAARFESGTENAPGRFALECRLQEILNHGPDQIEDRILTLRDQIADAFQADGWQITSPGGPSRSGIVTARRDGIDPGALSKDLEAEGIRTSARGGALRVSPHAYNTKDEIDRFAEAIARARLQ